MPHNPFSRVSLFCIEVNNVSEVSEMKKRNKVNVCCQERDFYSSFNRSVIINKLIWMVDMNQWLSSCVLGQFCLSWPF